MTHSTTARWPLAGTVSCLIVLGQGRLLLVEELWTIFLRRLQARQFVSPSFPSMWVGPVTLSRDTDQTSPALFLNGLVATSSVKAGTTSSSRAFQASAHTSFNREPNWPSKRAPWQPPDTLTSPWLRFRGQPLQVRRSDPLRATSDAPRTIHRAPTHLPRPSPQLGVNKNSAFFCASSKSQDTRHTALSYHRFPHMAIPANADTGLGENPQDHTLEPHTAASRSSLAASLERSRGLNCPRANSSHTFSAT